MNFRILIRFLPTYIVSWVCPFPFHLTLWTIIGFLPYHFKDSEKEAGLHENNRKGFKQVFSISALNDGCIDFKSGSPLVGNISIKAEFFPCVFDEFFIKRVPLANSFRKLLLETLL